MTKVAEKMITTIEIAGDLNGVDIHWKLADIEASMESDAAGEEDEEGDASSSKAHGFSCNGKHRPHADFVKAMKTLRKFALEASEMTVDSKEINTWTVSKIAISGDMTLRKSRVLMTLAHTVKRTSGIQKMKGSQIVMYPEPDDAKAYHNAAKMSEQIEAVIEEAWEYLNGKIEEGSDPQLPLFPTKSKKKDRELINRG